MKELVSPAQSEILVAVAALLVSFIGGALAWRHHGRRAGILLIGCGAWVFASWQAHKWLTRFDARSGYFGLDSVQVLALEALAFTMAGAIVGWAWSKIRSCE